MVCEVILPTQKHVCMYMCEDVAGMIRVCDFRPAGMVRQLHTHLGLIERHGNAHGSLPAYLTLEH